MSIFFTDQAEFRIDEEGEDFLKGTLTLSKVGVYDYYVKDDDGQVTQVKRAKLPEELFSAATRDSANLKPITDGHPLDDKGEPILVDSSNYKKLVRGTIGKPWVDGEFLRAPAMVYDADLRKEIKSGEKKEASIGFLTEDDATPGNYHGEAFDSAQREMRVNHAAIVRAGRAGPDANFYVDMKEDVMLKFRTDDGKELTIDGTDPTAIHALLTSLKQERDEAKKKVEGDEGDNPGIKKLQEQIDELQEKLKAKKPEGDEAKVEELQKEITTLNDKVTNAADAKVKAEGELKKVADAKPAEIREQAAIRGKLEGDAKSAGIEADISQMENRDVHLQVISKHMAYADGINVDEKSDQMVADRFETVMDMLRSQAADRGATPPGGKPVATADSVDKKRQVVGDWHAQREAQRNGTA